jgi:putative transposase
MAEKFIRSLIEKYGKHTVYTDGGTWYPQACTFLHLNIDCILIGEEPYRRVVQYFKDRVESFYD